MKIKTSELQGSALDWAVAKCEGRKPSCYTGIVRATAHPDFPDSPPIFGPELNYSADWALAGPIIERDIAKVERFSEALWEATAYTKDAQDIVQSGPTPLTAAMRCYVASKLGDEVEVPDELLQS
jgi:hypothetical protein